MKKYLFGFIGCGHMGATLVKALAKRVAGKHIAVCDRNAGKVDSLKKELGACPLDAETLVKESKFVVLGVKPQDAADTLASLRGAFAKNDEAVVITMVAGLGIKRIREMASGNFPVVRIMPNTPCEVGVGTVLYALANTNEEEKNTFLDAFCECGLLVPVKEEQIDGAGVLTGCGPAFYYLYAKALADATAALGIDGAMAVELAAQTMLGASKMLLKYGDAERLCQEVCSPGGTTVEGVETLRKQGVPESAKNAVKASYVRTLELKNK